MNRQPTAYDFSACTWVTQREVSQHHGHTGSRKNSTSTEGCRELIGAPPIGATGEQRLPARGTNEPKTVSMVRSLEDSLTHGPVSSGCGGGPPAPVRCGRSPAPR